MALQTVCCFFALCLSFASALSNLDAREPIVRQSPANDTDYFGYSVILHQIREPDDGDFSSFLESTRLIVGAPKGTYPGGLTSLPELNPVLRTGLIYNCPIKSPGGCDGLLSANTEPDVANNDRRLFDGDPNGFSGAMNDPEMKGDQLMGSVLASNGNIFVACAPRWVTIPPISPDLDGRRPVGRCFVSSRGLQNFTAIMPCSGRLQPNPSLVGFDNHCYTGFSASILSMTAQDAVAVSLLGDAAFNGNLLYFDPSTSPPSEITRTTNPLSENFVQTVYEGYSTTTGYITSSTTQDVISGVPRFDGNLLKGGVRIRSQSDLGGDPAIPIVEGFQTGEYFGYAVATADLNNDGFDELIVGAPIYSTNTSQELGRIYIFENVGGDVNRTGYHSLTGRSVPLSRFGTSIVNLGDINGDDYEDIAVGAPYEVSDDGNTGAVYIYYGASSESGLISQSPDQIISAQDIVDVIPDVLSLHTFGFSLASGIDVDGNLFNDLLIGAYESKTAVLLRSLSVASVVVDVSTNVDSVTVGTSAAQSSNFVLTVCARYSGRGLDGRSLNASLEVTEIFSNPSRFSRLYFQNDPAMTTFTTDFMFRSTGAQTCVDVTVFVKSAEQIVAGGVDLLTPFEVEVDFQPIERSPPTFSDGNPVNLIDYRTIPIMIIGGNTTASVMPTVNCSLDENSLEVCRPDLTVTLANLVYMDAQNNLLPGDEAIAGSVETVHIELSFSNIGEDPAFGSELSFTLPARYTFVQALVPAGVTPINCLRAGDALNFTCKLPGFIPSGSETNRVTLIWRLTAFIVGNEEDDLAMVSIRLTSSRDMETNISNNALINGPIRITYSASADVDISTIGFQPSTPVTYRGIPPDSVDPTIDELGPKLNLTLTAVNRGPSATPNAAIDIYIPTNDIEESYYIYLFNVTATEIIGGGSVECDNTTLNPLDLQRADGRSKRNAKVARQVAETNSETQVSTEITTEIRDCSAVAGRSEFCSRVRCNVRDFPSFASVSITVSAVIDERFFEFQRADFVFLGHAAIRNTEEFVQDENEANNRESTAPYRIMPFEEPEITGGFPFWIPIVGVIAALIMITVLFVLLYFFGFFRRKKREPEKDVDAEVDFVRPVPRKPGDSVEPLDPLENGVFVEEAEDIPDHNNTTQQQKTNLGDSSISEL